MTSNHPHARMFRKTQVYKKEEQRKARQPTKADPLPTNAPKLPSKRTIQREKSLSKKVDEILVTTIPGLEALKPKLADSLLAEHKIGLLNPILLGTGTSSNVRVKIITAIGSLGHKSGVLPLLQAMFQRRCNPKEHHEVNASLIKLGKTLDLIPELTSALSHPAPIVRNAALAQLEDLSKYPDPRITNSILEKLETEKELFLRRRMIYLLCALRDPNAIPAIALGLDDPDHGFRLNSLKGLAKIDHPDATNAVIGALTHPYAPLRSVAAQLLKEKKGSKVALALIRSIKRDPDHITREEAIKSLAEKTHPLLERAMFTSLNDEFLREHAEAILKARFGFTGLKKNDALTKWKNEELRKILKK